jgi:hypothetical protein
MIGADVIVYLGVLMVVLIRTQQLKLRLCVLSGCFVRWVVKGLTTISGRGVNVILVIY